MYSHTKRHPSISATPTNANQSLIPATFCGQDYTRPTRAAIQQNHDIGYSSRNTTPSKYTKYSKERRIMFADKENNCINVNEENHKYSQMNYNKYGSKNSNISNGHENNHN